MKKLLIICQKVDEVDYLLGFFVPWIREFASHYDGVTIITLATGDYSLPDHVRVLPLYSAERTPKWKQALRLLRLLFREVRTHDAVFAHMSPIFAVVAWPFTTFWKKNLVLWYLHRSTTLKLRIALAMCTSLVTADVSSLTIRSPKIKAVGHGIDISRFAITGRTPPVGRPLRILSVGRLTPIKGFETLIRAATLLRERDVRCEVRIVGKAVMPSDHQYEQQLRLLVTQLGIGDVVHFFGTSPYSDMPGHFKWADIVIGCTPTGGIDKVLLEGMASGCVVFTSNSVMRKHLGNDAERLLFPVGNVTTLTEEVEGTADFTELSGRMVEYARKHNLADTVRAISLLL